MSTNKAQSAVRLSAKEIAIIRDTVNRVIGHEAHIYLFGSRARVNEKGGDIDLLIETTKNLPDKVAGACRLTSELQLLLGEQKIDVIVTDQATNEQPIHQMARQTGVML